MKSRVLTERALARRSTEAKVHGGDFASVDRLAPRESQRIKDQQSKEKPSGPAIRGKIVTTRKKKAKAKAGEAAEADEEESSEEEEGEEVMELEDEDRDVIVLYHRVNSAGRERLRIFLQSMVVTSPQSTASPLASHSASRTNNRRRSRVAQQYGERSSRRGRRKPRRRLGRPLRPMRRSLLRRKRGRR